METLVFQELRAVIDYYHTGYTLYFYRTATGVEVDFILYGKKGIIAIEVKLSKKWQTKDLTGLKTFRMDYPGCDCFLFYGGQKKEFVENITIWPVEDALQNLKSILKI